MNQSTVSERVASERIDIWTARVRPGMLAHLKKHITVVGEREALPVFAPFTGEQIEEVPACTAEDVQEALKRARKAQVHWRKVPHRERRAIMLRFHERVLDCQATILDLAQIESGKARRHAFEEALDVVITTRYYAFRAEGYMHPRRRKGAFPLLTVTRQFFHPVGVVGLIAPWNYPVTLAVSDAIPALLAGNAVILKPAEQTPFTALYMLELLLEAGLPEDVFQVVTGYGPELGPPLIEGVNFIGFTGSTEVGRIVARQAGERLIHASLELGGKNPAIVLNDADVPRTVEGMIRGSFTNAGQLCISFERVYIQRGIFEHFVNEFLERIRQMKIGPGFDWDIEMGSMISEEQVERVDAYVQDAVSKGATLLAGGRRRPDLGPWFYEPTVLMGIREDMRLCREEVFGPVAALYRFDDVEEAIQAANDSEYGLNASIWTRNRRLAWELAPRIECGTVNINEAYAAAWGSLDAPMGGMKASGLGRRHGSEGFYKYTESQTVAEQRLVPIAPFGGISAEHFAQATTFAMRLLRYIPGLR